MALLFAVVCRELIFDLFHLYTQHACELAGRGQPIPAQLQRAASGVRDVDTLVVLPYAAVLYGIHDRFVRLASAVTLGTTVAFMFMPWASILFAAATVILAAAALVSKSWRKPLEALACTATAGILTIAAVDSLRLHFHPLGPRGRRQSWHPRLRELIPLTRPRLLQAAPPVPTAAAYWRLYYGVEIPATRSKQ